MLDLRYFAESVGGGKPGIREDSVNLAQRPQPRVRGTFDGGLLSVETRGHMHPGRERVLVKQGQGETDSASAISTSSRVLTARLPVSMLDIALGSMPIRAASSCDCIPVRSRAARIRAPRGLSILASIRTACDSRKCVL